MVFGYGPDRIAQAHWILEGEAGVVFNLGELGGPADHPD